MFYFNFHLPKMEVCEVPSTVYTVVSYHRGLMMIHLYVTFFRGTNRQAKLNIMGLFSAAANVSINSCIPPMFFLDQDTHINSYQVNWITRTGKVIAFPNSELKKIKHNFYYTR